MSAPRIVRHGLVDSTSERAFAALAAGEARHRDVHVARAQSAGRGSRGRSWDSQDGAGLYASVVLLPEPPAPPPAALTMAAGLAVRDLLLELGLAARLKWPNDVLVGGAKIAGILIEARIQEDRVFLMIGTGINVEPVKDDTRPNAITIREASTRPLTGTDDATLAFIEHLDEQLSHPLEHDAVLEQWRALTIHRPGDRIHCVLGEKTVDGTWARIDEEGRAVLNTSEGPIVVSAGDLLLPES